MLLIMVAMNVCMTSCGDDDDEPVKGNSSLVGTWEVYEPDIILRVEFKSNNKGTMSLIHSNGDDPDFCNFEYVEREDLEGNTYLRVVGTGSDIGRILIDAFYGDREYKITITPTRLVWGDITYIRK